MKDYQPFSAEIKSEISDEIKNNFGHIYSDKLIAIFIKIMEESTFVELDFADLLVFLHESSNKNLNFIWLTVKAKSNCHQKIVYILKVL